MIYSHLASQMQHRQPGRDHSLGYPNVIDSCTLSQNDLFPSGFTNATSPTWHRSSGHVPQRLRMALRFAKLEPNLTKMRHLIRTKWRQTEKYANRSPWNNPTSGVRPGNPCAIAAVCNITTTHAPSEPELPVSFGNMNSYPCRYPPRVEIHASSGTGVCRQLRMFTPCSGFCTAIPQ